MATSFENFLKSSLLFKIIANPRWNSTFRSIWRYIRPFAPQQFRDLFPVTGLYQSSLPDGRKIMLNSAQSNWLSAKLCWQGIASYEPETTSLFSLLVHYSKTILDIGANTGIFSLLAATDNPTATIYAFEPIPYIFEQLTTHVKINNLNNIIPLKLAISDVDEERTIYISHTHEDTALDASLMAGFRKNCSALKVASRTLDSLDNEFGFSEVDLMKVDTESSEHLVLLGAQQLINRERPFIICEVLYGTKEEELYEILKGWDYRYFWITAQELIEQKRPIGDRSYQHNNYLFVHKERMSGLESAINQQFEILHLS